MFLSVSTSFSIFVSPPPSLPITWVWSWAALAWSRSTSLLNRGQHFLNEFLQRFFTKISHFLKRILMEHITVKNSLDSKLKIYSRVPLEFVLESKISLKNRSSIILTNLKNTKNYLTLWLVITMVVVMVSATVAIFIRFAAFDRVLT